VASSGAKVMAIEGFLKLALVHQKFKFGGRQRQVTPATEKYYQKLRNAGK